MSKRDVNLLLEDMLESVKKIKRYTADLSFEDFLKDEKTSYVNSRPERVNYTGQSWQRGIYTAPPGLKNHRNSFYDRLHPSLRDPALS
ncbi:HepT-like ribonuclease domain-containing protein [Cyclobacterium salsum]|uniref:HepT-like ribonuclease domain-containing protein n=1 Tax=Cyclobacterium salsum TaxID=2666329 RepID=UPI001390B5AE|nr:hypothetical protein [Cyclobacterium salsum]